MNDLGGCRVGLTSAFLAQVSRKRQARLEGINLELMAYLILLTKTLGMALWKIWPTWIESHPYVGIFVFEFRK